MVGSSKPGLPVRLEPHLFPAPIENEAILIDGPPKPVLLAADGDDHFIKIPFIAEPTLGFPSDIFRKAPPEFLGPKAHCVVRDNDPARRQQVFHHPQTERETKIKPDGMRNHFSWEPVAAIKGITNGLGHAAKSHRPIAARLTQRCRLAAGRKGAGR